MKRGSNCQSKRTFLFCVKRAEKQVIGREREKWTVGWVEVVTIASAVSNTSSIGNLGDGVDTKSSGIWLYLLFFFSFPEIHIYIYIYFFFLTYRTEFIYLLVHFAPRFYKIK